MHRTAALTADAAATARAFSLRWENRDGERMTAGALSAELASVVEAPAAHAAVGRDRARVPVGSDEIDGVFGAGERHRHRRRPPAVALERACPPRSSDGARAEHRAGDRKSVVYGKSVASGGI